MSTAQPNCRSTPVVDWDARYRDNHTPWDHGEAAPPLVEFLHANPINGDVVVPGCGSGHDVRLVARFARYAVGLDIAPTAIQNARNYPQSANIDYVVADLFSPPEHLIGKFDWVIEHTCFCTLQGSDRDLYVDAVARLLRSRGHLLAVFYLQPHNDDPKKPPFPATSTEIDRRFHRNFRSLRQYTPRMAFESRLNREQVRLMRRIS